MCFNVERRSEAEAQEQPDAESREREREAVWRRKDAHKALQATPQAGRQGQPQKSRCALAVLAEFAEFAPRSRVRGMRYSHVF